MGEEISCYCYVWIRRSWVAWTEDKLQANGMEITALQDFPSEEEYTEMVNLEHKVINKEEMKWFYELYGEISSEIVQGTVFVYCKLH